MLTDELCPGNDDWTILQVSYNAIMILRRHTFKDIETGHEY